MNMIKGIVGVIAVLAFMFVGLPLMMFGGASEWRYHFGSGTPPPVAKLLTKENAEQPARLTAAERRELVAHCVTDFRNQRNPDASEARNVEIRKELEGHAENACDCMIDGLEDSLTTLQFTLAMASGFTVGPKLNTSNIEINDNASAKSIESIAEKYGVAEKTMNQARFKALDSRVALSRKCRGKT